MDESGWPYRYSDWYLPLIDAGEPMPDSIEAGVSESNSGENAAGGDGIIQ